MIGIAGLGGIGSNIAVNLVRSGIGPLKLVDMDLVEEGNLNRQFYFADQIGQPKVEALTENLQRIGTGVAIASCHAKISRNNCANIFTGCELLVEGVDDENTKKIVLEEMAPRTRLIVSACGIAGAELQGISSRKMGNCIIVGDFSTASTAAPLYLHKLQAICARMTETLLEDIK
ncbi:MAG: thiamine biosynthesis protein ThiF [Deltaproteobacteria bacterium]|nr:MAG: thiamine biosynthesis protein ThiF [Deltaproteobacteria bacterium]